MGVEELLRDAFTRAREYQARVEDVRRRQQRRARQRGGRRHRCRRAATCKLDALVEVLEGKRLVHCHSYRADEILMMLRVAKDFGFRVATFQHVLEGYKVADEIAAAGTGATTFADIWAYKLEAWDAIPAQRGADGRARA